MRHVLTVDSECKWCGGRGFVADQLATHPCRCVEVAEIETEHGDQIRYVLEGTATDRRTAEGER